MRRVVFILIGSIIFFLVGVFTIHDYGISWDETLHFRRGEAYLYYFLTGKLNYQDLPKVNLQGTSGESKKIAPPRRSFYQNDYHNGEFLIASDSGHPPISDELAALSNFIFFQKLGLLDDISSFHLFNILASALLVFFVCLWVSENFGFFASFISYLVLQTYPLFFAESHFNIKDPPETAFFTATIYCFIKSLDKKNIGWLVSSFIFGALALGTKFNVIFLPFILVPYLLIRFREDIIALFKKKKIPEVPSLYLLVLLLGPLLSFLIFFAAWPFLWHNFWTNFSYIVFYYQDIGTGTRYQPQSFFIYGFNSFPILWIIYTTPPVVLFLTLIGIFSSLVNWKIKKNITTLYLLFFLVPILRVSSPNTVIYGGVRQIMEFLPAMACLCGVATWQILKLVLILGKRKLSPRLAIFFSGVSLCALFSFPMTSLIVLHPYENIYFNFLIGGLKGAQERNFPSWGNTFGSVYKSGIDWVNAHVEKNAKLSLIQGTAANAPAIYLRSDIDYKNENFSGIERSGEYLMEMTFNDTTQAFNYAWDYVNNFLIPVYELKVDDVAILKIWKNDLTHTTTNFQKPQTLYQESLKVFQSKQEVILKLQNSALLSKIIFDYQDLNCHKNGVIFIETSLDGKDWRREKDWIPYYQVSHSLNDNGKQIIYYFAARRAQFVKLVSDRFNSCNLGSSNFSIFIL